ncbi:MAG TPA: isochorismatase family protein [Mobilitalea sp.]|nr:isochorismatase family protein [Mobilitalea sp.]
MRIIAEDTLALVVDFQERLVPVIQNSSELLKNTEILIKGLKTLGVPMIVTQQYTKGIGMTVPSIIEALGGDIEFNDKLTFSCVDDTMIYQKVMESGKKNIIVCGIEAHICVLQTIIDLIAKGYHVILVENCIGSRKENDRAVAVRRAAAEGAIITTYESILFELTRVSKTEVFKEISRLIK